MEIVLEHLQDKVTRIHGLDDGAATYLGRPVLKVLLTLAKDFPGQILGWVQQDHAAYYSFGDLSQLLHNPRELISYTPQGANFIGPEVAYVEDTPFVNIDPSVRYPTWKMSSTAGAMHAELVIAATHLASQNYGFDYFLNSFAKLGQSLGVLCYSEPRLLGSRAESLEVKPVKASVYSLFKFVRQHYKGRWALLLMLNLWVYERRLTISPFFYALFFRQRKARQINLPAIADKMPLQHASVDVLIPTIGRAGYLKDVLNDLAKQELLPKRVLIMEQTPKPGMASELDYLENPWPFQIVHQLLYPPGACKSRNIALDQIQSEYVFLADDDLRIPEDFLSRAVAFLKTWKAKAATLSCLQEGETEVHHQVRQWTTFASGCSLVCSSALSEIRFDPALEFGYGEDKDFGMQLRRRGIDILYNPHIKVLHLKAPVGGFRYEVQRPWEDDEVVPKPSPTVLYFKIKHSSARQLKGYKTTLLLKYYKDQELRNPFAYYKRFKQQWRSSVAWANKLKNN